MAEEFVLESDADLADEEVEEVFSYGSRTAYRFMREQGCGCPCECVERHDCPLVEVYTREGTLHLTFHAPDMERLRAVLTDLRESYPQMDVRRLLQSVGDGAEQDLVVVDRSDLTDRQFEVLSTAHEMGYFDHPKAANAGEIAQRLDISRSTFTEHLSVAQSKVLTAVLSE